MFCDRWLTVCNLLYSKIIRSIIYNATHISLLYTKWGGYNSSIERLFNNPYNRFVSKALLY